MRRLRRALVAGGLFLATTVSAQAQSTCRLTQITNSIGSVNPSINSTGTRIAFASSDNLTGGNGDGGWEIFLWDAATGLTQITEMDDPFVPAVEINGAGDRMVFASSSNPLGTNGDGNVEIFLWDASAGLTQITNTTSGDSSAADINEAGNRIVFNSNAPLGTSADGNREIFLWDAATGLTQITNSTGGDNFLPSIDANGTRIAFQAENNALGGNLDGNFEIVLWDSSTGLTQITHTTNGDNFVASINDAGNRIAFASNVATVEGVPSFDIFLWDAATGFQPITEVFARTSYFPAINGVGNRIAFESQADLVGGNGDGSQEIFLWESSTGFTQITNSPNIPGAHTSRPSINPIGDQIAFVSSGNLVGTNGDGSIEVFLASCPLIVETSIPAVSPLGLAALIVLLGLAAAWTLRRRRA
jgi:Tol biopolymer transport system component